MCGIAGIVCQKPSQPEELKRTLKSMTDALVHRGPEGEGHWLNAEVVVALGHRRLKIIDLTEAAAQPMHYAGRYTITYNGEIYNYPELKTTLKAKGYRFENRSDTEVVLAAFDCWQEGCLEHFDGMFAFAIWDEHLRQLFCARDRFGEKPFYFQQLNGRFIFASEMKALWAAGAAYKVDNNRLLNYISPGLVSSAASPESTFFSDIYTLPPAHYLKIAWPGEELQIVNYWDIDKESTLHDITADAAVEQFSALLQRSVSRRLRSDVKIGTSLSGGLDSSTIVSLMTSNEAFPDAGIDTFSAVFPGFEKDEGKYIREIVYALHVNNFQSTPTGLQLAEDFDKLVYFQEEPFQSLSIYAQYKVYEMAKQYGVSVILDGQGADETLAGYHKYYQWFWQELFGKDHVSVRRERKETAALGISIPWGMRNRFAAFLPQTTSLQLQNRAWRQQATNPLINKEFLAANSDKRSLVKPVVRKLNDLLYFHTCQGALQELLRYADRNSMAHSREVRLPFLDHELVQFVFSLPSHLKIHKGWTKWILREAMQNRLPEMVIKRAGKVGFEPPQEQWMKDPAMKQKIMWARELLVKEKVLLPAVLQQPIAAKAAHQEGNDDFRFLCAASLVNGRPQL